MVAELVLAIMWRPCRQAEWHSNFFSKTAWESDYYVSMCLQATFHSISMGTSNHTASARTNNIYQNDPVAR